MEILRVFPRRTSHTPHDSMAFVGDPPLERPEADEVHVSCVFTWDKPAVERLKLAWGQYYPVVKLGGPAYDDHGNGFIPGMYVKRGIVYNMRGCNNQCPWCVAWRREGSARAIPITEGNDEQSNNLLQCDYSHIDAVFDMLTSQHKVTLAGIEAVRVNERWAERIRSLHLSQIFLGCDTPEAIRYVRRALNLLQLPPNSRKARCYVLLKYDPTETMVQALIRLLQVWEAGAIPFAQLYQPVDKKITYPVEWTRFARTFQRPAATVAFIRDLINSNAKGSN